MRNIKEMLNISTRREKNRGNLWAAIHAQHILEFDFHGRHRVAEPFALGLTRRGSPNNESLLCYQTSRSGDKTKSEGWRVFPTSEIKELKVSKIQFTGDRPGYEPYKMDMAEVVYCIKPQKPVSEMGLKNPPVVKPSPITTPTPPTTRTLTHNELMRRFRSSHPADAGGTPPACHETPRQND